MKKYVQYYLVNKELDMSGHKAGVQVGHGATIVGYHHKGEENFEMWYKDEQKKILLAASEKQMNQWIEQNEWTCYPVYDNGHTEIPPNSFTVVAFAPYLEEDIKPVLKRYQLYKGYKGPKKNEEK